MVGALVKALVVLMAFVINSLINLSWSYIREELEQSTEGAFCMWWGSWFQIRDSAREEGKNNALLQFLQFCLK